MPKKLTIHKFITKARLIHGDKYKYNKVIYINNNTNVVIICPIHGEFKQTPANHLSGKGCNECGVITQSSKRRKSEITFIEDAIIIHNNEYDYSKIEYIDRNTKVWLKHNTCGYKFEQLPSNHLQGQGCPYCRDNKISKSKTYNLDTFIKKSKIIHGDDKYDYSKSVYINSNKKILIKHNVCGNIFEQKPKHHLQGHGCPKCNISKMEKEMINFLEENKIQYIHQHTFDWLKNKRNLYLDFYLPEYNIAIECQGEQHFNPINFKKGVDFIKKFDVTIENDKLKFELCKNNNVDILYIITNKQKLKNEYFSTIYRMKDVFQYILKNFKNDNRS